MKKRGFGVGRWNGTGGKFDAGKDKNILGAAIRETKEEIGVDLIPDTIKYLNTFTDAADGKENTLVKLTCYSADFIGTPTPNSEIEELGWLNTKNILIQGRRNFSWGPDVLYEYIRRGG